MKRTTAIAVLAYLVLGAIATFAVAAMVTWLSFPGCTKFQSESVLWGEGVLHLAHPTADPQGRSVAQQFESRGFGWSCKMASSNDQPLADSKFRASNVRESGLPFHAFTGRYDTDPERGTLNAQHAIAWARWPTPLYMWAFIPTKPMWPGLVADVLFFTGVAALTHRGPGVLRRVRRARAGRCVQCGYRIDSQDVCPECGHTNTPRATPNAQAN